MLKRVLMSSAKTVGVRDLPGFDKKLHRVPDRASAFAEKLVGELTKEELEAEINGIAKRAREVFGYTRKEVNASVIPGGGSVITPGFEFAVSVTLDPDSPSEVIWRRELRGVEGESGAALDTVFAGVFDRLEMEFAEKQSVTDVIDRIEALKSRSITVDYQDTDLSKCEVRVEGFAGRILVTDHSLTILNRDGAGPSELLNAFNTARRMVLEETGGDMGRLTGA